MGRQTPTRILKKRRRQDVGFPLPGASLRQGIFPIHSQGFCLQMGYGRIFLVMASSLHGPLREPHRTINRTNNNNNLKKYKFLVIEVKYLKLIIITKGVHMDPKKVYIISK